MHITKPIVGVVGFVFCFFLRKKELALNTIHRPRIFMTGNEHALSWQLIATGVVRMAYEEIPQVMQDPLIDSEDHTFWTKSGVDPQGLTRAAFLFST